MKTLFSMFILLLFSCSCSDVKQDSHLSDWARANSIEIKSFKLNNEDADLLMLKQIVGDAQLVCLGESRHDVREQVLLKTRFIKFLVEEMDFNVFLLEASMPYSELINNYIYNDEGSIEDIMAEMPGWFLWDTEEMKNIFEWMKDYNSEVTNSKKIRFYGIDIVAPEYALDRIFEYLEEVDISSYNKLIINNFGRDYIDDDFWPNTQQNYAQLSDEQKLILKGNYDKLRGLLAESGPEYIARTSYDKYQWISQLAYCAGMANKMFSAVSPLDLGLIREKAMAQNVLWLKESLLEDKAILWAHNLHIIAADFYMPLVDQNIKGMGGILKNELGDEMKTIGATFNLGEFPSRNRIFPKADSNSIDGMMAQIGSKYSLLNLKAETANNETLEWLNTPQLMRAQDFTIRCVPLESFDALYFTDSISHTIPSQHSAERLRRMN